MQFNTKLIRFHRTIATPLSTLNWVSAYDVANCIVNCIYKQSENYGKIYEITALEQQTAEYFSSCLSKSIGESVTHVEIEMDEMLEFFVNSGFSEEKGELLMEHVKDSHTSDTSQDIYNLLGREPEDFECWVEKNSHLFL